MKNVVKFAILSSCLAGAVVHAASSSGAGTSSYQDASLTVNATKEYSDKFVLALDQNINPVQSAAGFASTFDFASTGTSTWAQAATVSSTGSVLDKLLGDGLTFSLNKSNDYSGTWTITNTNTTKNLTVDLVLSLHAGNGVGSFLFDNQVVKAGSTLQGNWAVNWINNADNANSIAKFSNVGIYTGASSFATAVPEPTTYGMMLGGLALLGYAARRRKA